MGVPAAEGAGRPLGQPPQVWEPTEGQGGGWLSLPGRGLPASPGLGRNREPTTAHLCTPTWMRPPCMECRKPWTSVDHCRVKAARRKVKPTLPKP